MFDIYIEVALKQDPAINPKLQASARFTHSISFLTSHTEEHDYVVL